MTEFVIVDGVTVERDVTDMIDDLRTAGVDVVPGNYWYSLGTPLSMCSLVSVYRTDTPLDETADVDRLKGGITAYIAESGRVWWLGQCTTQAGRARIVLAAAEFEPINPKQREALDIVLAVLDSVAFGARVEEELTPADRPPDQSPLVPVPDVAPPIPARRPQSKTKAAKNP